MGTHPKCKEECTMSQSVMWLLFFAVVAVIILFSTLSKKRFTIQ